MTPERSSIDALIMQARFEPGDVADLDIDEIADLAAGRDVDDAVRSGQSIDHIAHVFGQTTAVARELRRRYVDLRRELAERSQTTLF
ncbi:hypothetical protein CH263_06390 [Rhodococcus sp. 06-1059B-a]|nr:hypothetical protein [Rhodococcus sp. 06-1059B-a]OZD70543.1 hypothetical protein CH263_06390 [Rhodococcus sp. 06-1059B-a]